jgi:transcriptional regulator GlxA family with amidase domain
MARADMSPKKVGLIVFEHVTAADLTGPAEVFSRANISGGNGCESSCYNVLMLGTTAQSCRTECGIVVKPHTDLGSAPALDTIIIPGGIGIHDEKVTNKIAKWLNDRSPTTRRIATLGTGIYPLAATGMLDNRQVATHWRYAADVAQRFSRLRVNANCLFVKDGQFYTSAGAMAGIDLSLSLTEEDYGIRVALVIARELVVSAKRSGLHEQYPATLQFQTKSVSRLSELTTWVISHLDENLSLEILAAKACLCPRHFTRRFKQEFGTSPAAFVERLRIDEACHRLSIRDNNVEDIAVSVGFKSAATFRRAFQRQLGINPNDYRRPMTGGGESVRGLPHKGEKVQSFSRAA